jgi:hypothetical protein
MDKPTNYNLQSSVQKNPNAIPGSRQSRNEQDPGISSATASENRDDIKKSKSISLRNLNNNYRKTRLRLLIWIGSLTVILIGLIVFAAFRAGGLQNLIQGDGNIISNTVNNVGNVIANPTASPTLTPTVFTFEATPKPIEETNLTQKQNTIVLTEAKRTYNIRVKKDSYILFVNGTKKIIGLQFSDTRQLRLEEGEQENMYFPNAANLTFQDVIDARLRTITGTVTVVN